MTREEKQVRLLEVVLPALIDVFKGNLTAGNSLYSQNARDCISGNAAEIVNETLRKIEL